MSLPQLRTEIPGPRSRELAKRLAAVESPAFEARREARKETSGEDFAPIVYASASGANVTDVDGNVYVDMTAGFGAMLLGHRSPPPTDLVLALGDVYASELKVRACEEIAKLFPERGARVMLGLSGSDAVTCALKTALLATKKPRVIAFEGSYHGLSHGPLALLGFAPSFREPFAAHLGVPVTFAPYPSSTAELDASLSAVRAALKGGDVGAILVEPMLGRGGCVVPPSSFLAALRSLAFESDALLVFDEIWSGMGRTGAMFAADHAGIVPDVLCLGKGLGGGVPISACIGKAPVMEHWGAHGGTLIHTATHFGSPPACAAALATIDALRSESLLEDVANKGETLLRELEQKGISARGRGLMIGIVEKDAASALTLARRLLAKGYIVLTGGAAGNVLTLSPPLTIAPALLSAFVAALVD